MNMNDIEALATLKQILLQTPYAKENQSHTHVIIRCPICGDSLKHQDTVHCYVNIEGGKPVSYYCFSNCSEGHWVNSEFLRSANIRDPKLIAAIWKYNKSFIGKEEYKLSRQIIRGTRQSAVPFYEKCCHEDKLHYIEERLGIQLTYQDCVRLKIILSLADFINMNAYPLNIKDGWARQIERDYVGFLSADNSYIVFRNTKGNEYRYVNYPVFKNSGNWGSKSYMIPGQYDLMANNIDCYITEGVFDLFGCFFNINDQKKENTIYGAVNGAGFLGFIKKIISMGFINNLNLKIISDGDKNKGFYYSLKSIEKLCKSIEIYYNRYPGQKDVGVRKEFIDLKKMKIIW